MWEFYSKKIIVFQHFSLWEVEISWSIELSMQKVYNLITWSNWYDGKANHVDVDVGFLNHLLVYFNIAWPK